MTQTNNRFQEYFKGISWPYFLLMFVISFTPYILHQLGYNIYYSNSLIDLSDTHTINELSANENLRPLLAGKFIHTIIVGISITIAFLTTILSFVDYFIKKNVSTPIVGIALFCSAMLDLIHILSADQIIHVDQNNGDISSFTWLFSRIFHALILILGVGIFLLQKKEAVQYEYKSENYFVAFITIIFLLLSINATLIVTDEHIEIPRMIFSDSFISHPYDLLPLFLYVIAGLFIFPRYYKQYPSTFSQTLILSLLPAIAAQIHMAFGSKDIYDYDFYSAQILKAVSYFVPFIGLTINYIETYKHETEVVEKLDNEFKIRSQVQNQLQGIMDVSLNGIMSYEAVLNEQGIPIDFRWQLVNPAAEQMTGLKKSDIIGKQLLETLEDTQDLFERYKTVYLTGSSMSFERMVMSTGKYYQIFATKLDDGVAITFNDITDQKKGQEAILNSQKIQATHKFARVITHEIKNPLTNITLAIEQLKSEPDFPSSQMMYLDILSRNSGRINQLITDVMNASKMTDLSLSQISSLQLIEESLALANDRIKLENIKVNYNRIDNIELNIDVAKMKLALSNLILNAIEAMSNRQGILSIHAYKLKNTYTIEISDNGIGMTEEQLNSIFEPFFTSKSKGFGIGLTASQTIIFNHGGNIDVRSELNEGTTFIVSIPV